MMWGCMTYYRVGYVCQVYDGTIKSEDYIYILDNSLKDTIDYYDLDKSDIIFQYDNDPKHTSAKTKAYLTDQQLNVLPWLAQSPNLNPIEHLWHYLKVKIGSYKSCPTSIHNLWSIIDEEWNKIS